MKIKLYRMKNTKKTKKILHEIINQNEIINNSATADRNNKSKETETESPANMGKENQDLKTLNKKLYNKNQYLKEEIKSLKRLACLSLGLACFNTLIILFNFVKSETKSGNKLVF